MIRLDSGATNMRNIHDPCYVCIELDHIVYSPIVLLLLIGIDVNRIGKRGTDKSITGS